MFHKILVAIDNSEMSQHVFDEAISLAKTVNGHIMLLHVLSPFDGGYLNPVLMQPASLYPMHTEAINKYIQQWEELKQERQKMLYSFAEKAKKAGIKTEFSQNLGDPGQTICNLACHWKADLIILGRRGRKGLSELFLGSVSNYVLHHAPCSVLTVQKATHTTTQVSPVSQGVSIT